MVTIDQLKSNPFWSALSDENRSFVVKQTERFRLSFMESKQLIDIARDFEMWQETPLSDFAVSVPKEQGIKEQKKALLSQVTAEWNRLKTEPNSYDTFTPKSDHTPPELGYIPDKKERTPLGKCPVASPKTRCCNLQTLDVVEGCGYDCSYCSIQSFYTGGKVLFDQNLKQKLDSLDLDPAKRYHIGTGQSSDSLLWGNREGILDNLAEFAEANPNVILELKTKSNSISWLLENDYPKNIITTWSLNPQTIIDNEEHKTVSLMERLAAAEQIAAKNRLVGFHFHPMVLFEGWKEEYGELFQSLTRRFKPDSVALTSLGTLTFIKPVLKKLRKRDFTTKILQMPLEDAEGKYSYPYETKKEMFSFAYESLKEWHDKVYFYMCMEDKDLWMDVFGREYESNDQFEEDMIDSYFDKIDQLS